MISIETDSKKLLNKKSDEQMSFESALIAEEDEQGVWLLLLDVRNEGRVVRLLHDDTLVDGVKCTTELLLQHFERQPKEDTE